MLKAGKVHQKPPLSLKKPLPFVWLLHTIAAYILQAKSLYLKTASHLTDWRTNGAFGYAFVNLKQVEDVLSFYERFHNFALPQSKSTKIWEVAYARLQGKIELEAHFATRARNPKIAPDFGLPSDTTETSTIESNTAETSPVNYSASSPKESRRTRRARAQVQRQQTGSKEQPDLASKPREPRRMRARKQQTESEQEFSAGCSR